MTGIGANAGQSIPASVRNTVTGVIKWGDATIDQAYYIGILASEHYLKRIKGENTTVTTEELYFALEALNRLDYFAEKYWGGQPSLNGFFIRDDIRVDSLNMPMVLNHLNQGLTVPLIHSIESDMMASLTTDKEMSLDQVIHLINGLALVVRLVTDSVSYAPSGIPVPFIDHEIFIRKEAINITNRLVNYMKEGNPIQVSLSVGDTNLHGIHGLNWDFMIKNPVTALHVARGHNATLLATGFTSSKYWITGSQSATTFTLKSQQALQNFLFAETNIIPGEDSKVMRLNATGNVWPAGVTPDSSNFLYNAQKLGPRAQSQSFEYISLLHQILYGKGNHLMAGVPVGHPFKDNPKAFYVDLMNNAPIGGPFNYANGNATHFEWSSTSRNVHPDRRGQLIPDFPGDYNGLDYMLLYNLYNIAFESPLIAQPTDGDRSRLTPFPNPFSDRVTLNTTSGKKVLYFELRNVLGTKVFESAPQSGPKVDIEPGHIPTGVYFLIVYFENEKSCFKLIKN